MIQTKTATPSSQSIGRNAKWSLAQTVISAGTVFVLYKYLYGHLGPESLGLWAVVVASVSVGRLAELGFSTTVLRYVSLHLSSGNRERASRILETGLISIGLPIGFLLFAMYPAIGWAMHLIVPAASLSEAIDILPYALLTLWLGIVGTIVQSAVDGCGRMDAKSRILIVGNLLYVPAGIFFSTQWGITGLAIAQALQTLLVGGLCWLVARRELPELQWLPRRWDRSCFSEVIRYAAGLQLGNLLLMLFEPATKMLLSRYCGLAEVAHFEMANQIISRVRALVTSVMQAYLPAIAGAEASASDAARKIVGDAVRFAGGIGMPAMAALVVSFPVISILWIGQIQSDFIVYGWILGIGWLLATLAMPTHFYCVGTGRIKAVLVAETTTVLLNALLGWGAAISGEGHLVALSMMIALVVGNLVTAHRAAIDLDFSLAKALHDSTARKLLIVLAITAAVLSSDIAVSLVLGLERHLVALLAVHLIVLSLTVVLLSDARHLLLARNRRERT